MEKQVYEEPEMEIISLEAGDVITDSCTTNPDGEVEEFEG